VQIGNGSLTSLMSSCSGPCNGQSMVGLCRAPPHSAAPAAAGGTAAPCAAVPASAAAACVCVD
jgi:hypothetical protein